MFGLLLTFAFFYMAYSFISLATKYKQNKYSSRPNTYSQESISPEVWDHGEVPWYLTDENNKNNSDNTSVLANPNKPLPLIPMALILEFA